MDLDGAGVRDVNVALILQGIREGAPKRRKPKNLFRINLLHYPLSL
jgi:hypothetical protein